MVTHDITTEDIIKRVEETLITAEYGLEDLINGPPEKKLVGLRNLVVFGRAVTNVLQNLRSTESDFDEWYTKYQEEMESDPLMRFFYDLRSKILKEGLIKVSTQTYIRKLNIPEDLGRFGPPPPNTIGFFIGDGIGGCGWEVHLPDGSKEKYYVELPPDIGSISLHFPEPPKSHLGQEIKDSNIETLSRMYINYLCQMVESAKKIFKSK